MSVSRRIGDHRPKLVLGLLVLLSLVSLASGTRGRVLGDGVRTMVGIVSMPFLFVFDWTEETYDYTSGLILDYGKSRTEAQRMRIELTELRQRDAQAREMRDENGRLRTMLGFERSRSDFTLLSSKVIQHSGGILTINRGSLHGLSPSMCVVSPDGIIGLITHVGPLTSSVATLQNADCRVDAMIRWNRVRGRVYGSGNELSSVCTMHYIDLKDQVQEGDEIVTSPDSVFPSGLPIGRIVGVNEEGEISKSADIMPAADPFRVDEVFVLIGANQDWMELSGQMESDLEKTEKTKLMDMQTMQERLAP